MDIIFTDPQESYLRHRHTSSRAGIPANATHNSLFRSHQNTHNVNAAASKIAAHAPDTCNPVAALLLPEVLTAVTLPVALPVTNPDAASFPVLVAATPAAPVPVAPPDVVTVVAPVLVKVKYNETSVLVPKTSTPPVIVPISMIEVAVAVQFVKKSSSACVAVAAPQYEEDMALRDCTGVQSGLEAFRGAP